VPRPSAGLQQRVRQQHTFLTHSGTFAPRCRSCRKTVRTPFRRPGLNWFSSILRLLWFCWLSQEKCARVSLWFCVKVSHECSHRLDDLSPQMSQRASNLSVHNIEESSRTVREKAHKLSDESTTRTVQYTKTYTLYFTCTRCPRAARPRLTGYSKSHFNTRYTF